MLDRLARIPTASTDRSQCHYHGSILPGPGRPHVFHRSSVDICGAGGMLMILTLSNFTVTSLLRRGSSAQALCLKGREDDGTSSEGFPISRHSLENVECLLTTTSTCFPLQKKSHSVMIGFCPDHEFLESGRCSPTRDGWNLKSQGDDPLPVWGALEPLDMTPDTLSHRRHLITTV